MRIMLILLFFSVCQIFASDSYSQTAKVSVKAEKMMLTDVFSLIERQSEFLFFYVDADVENVEVNLNAINKPVDEILKQALQNTSLSYTIHGRNINIVRKNEAPQQQTRIVSGVVLDEYEEPVIGANVVVKGTITGVMTDIEGRFSLEAAPHAVIAVSYIGYLTQEVNTGQNTVFTIRLLEDTQILDEVVVIGFGTQKKLNLTGAVSTVTGEDMAKRPVANTSTMLQGQVSGLRITSNIGQPGNETVQMRIRGQGTYSTAGSDPLVLINGVEGSLANLDPNVIESVSVLKDAASAAIYGARAANGVVLITTKNGEGMKDRVAISYRGNYAIHSAMNMPDQVWDSPTYMKYWNIAKRNSGRPEAEMYTDEMIRLYTNPTDKERYPSFNWLDYMFRDVFVHQHNMSAMGSSGRTSYNVSLSMIDQPGTMRGFEYDRYNVTVDLTSSINDWIRMGAYFTGSRSTRQETRRLHDDAYLSTMSQAPTYMPWLPDDGSGVRRYTYKAYEFEGNNKNQAAIIEGENFKQYKVTDVNAQLWLEVTPVKGLTWHTKGAIRYNYQHEKDWAAGAIPQYYYHSGDFGIYLNRGGDGFTSTMNTYTYLNFYTYLKYDWQTPNKAHSFSGMAGYNIENYLKDNLSGYRQSYTFDLHELNAGEAEVQTNSGYSQEWGLLSGFFRFDYNYKERYLLSLNARYDGSSRISPEARWGFFPSFSAAWRVTEESWMDELNLQDWLTNLKIRGSYGVLGNQNVDLYSYYARIEADTNYSFDNSSLQPGAGQKAISNRNLKWESTAITDIGVDLTLFNRLNITFDWYKKRTYDILRQAQSTNLLGLNAPFINDGEVVNKGIEVDLQYSNTVKAGKLKGLFYNVGFYVDRSRNKLTKFGEDEISNGLIKREGLPYESFYAYDAIGIFRDWDDVNNSPVQFNDATQPGDIKYRDVSGPDGVPDGIIDSYDRIEVKGRFPDFEYAVNLSAGWKGFDLSLLGQGVQGAKHYATGWGLNPFYQGSPISYDYLENMWTEENPDGKYPRLYHGDMGGVKNTRESTYWIHNASYFRLKNLTFGYTLPKQLTQKARINMLRVYFSGDNLVTISKFPRGGDPERNYDSKSSTRLTYYPQNRIYSFGVNVEF